MSMMIRQSTALDALRRYDATPSKDPARLRELQQAATGEVVGQVFFGTLLQEVRAQSDPNNPLNGGRAGMMFTGELQQQLLGKIANSSQCQVSRALAKSWFGPANAVGGGEE